jgi:hypothetical protein
MAQVKTNTRKREQRALRKEAVETGWNRAARRKEAFANRTDKKPKEVAKEATKSV